MTTPWECFAAVARHDAQRTDRVPVALIVDSPWLPGYADLDTLDFFLRPADWQRKYFPIQKGFFHKSDGWLMVDAAFGLRNANCIKAFTHRARDYN